jgi:hypothetical protein
LPALLNRNTKILLFAVDMTRTVNSPNPHNYQIMEGMLCYINKWFKANLLSLNLGGKKTQWLQINTIKNCSQDIQLAYKNKHIVQTSSTKFLGLMIDDTLSWKNHIDYVTAELNSACFAVRMVKLLLPEML